MSCAARAAPIRSSAAGAPPDRWGEEEVADTEFACPKALSGEFREERDRQVDVDAGSVADTLGGHTAAVRDHAQGLVTASEDLARLHAVLAGDESDATAALVESAVVQAGSAGMRKQRTSSSMDRVGSRHSRARKPDSVDSDADV